MNPARPAGDAGLLIDSDVPHQLAAAIAAARLPAVIDVVPGARTVLVITEPGAWAPGELANAVAALPVREPDADATAVAEIPVVYDGPDLADVASQAGLTVADVVALHQGGEYTVGWLGFSPGFGYLTGLDRRLCGVPRLASPRVSVPAGAVAIAGGLTAVYPSASPGGWRLLGHTTARMWDPAREPPALLRPGQKVRFIAVPAEFADTGHPAPRRERTAIAGSADWPESTDWADWADSTDLASTETPVGPASLDRGSPQAKGARLEVVKPGLLATVQDLGRPGLAAFGVPSSGAADAASLIAANRLAGNADGTAGIELSLGRAVFRCIGGSTLAAAGAPARITVDAGTDRPARREIAFGTAFNVPDGALVSVGAPEAGLRTYLAVRGGVAVPAVLGSRSADLHSGLGGSPLRPGDVLPTGALAGHPSPPAEPPVGLHKADGQARARVPIRGEPVQLRIVPGPRLDWYRADALDILCGSPYAVRPASNRTGLRLTGQAVPRLSDAELASEGMVTGSVQVPHDGQPIVLLADHPTVGGYPVIAVLASADIGLAAQLRPGDQVRFVPSPLS